MKIELKVPMIIPIIIAKEKLRILSPPRTKIDTSTIKVDTDVLIVRERDLLDISLCKIMLMLTQVLTDTVVNNHRIVDIITDNCQDGTDERLVNLK